MYLHDTPTTRLYEIFEGARSFGLTEQEAWHVIDESLDEVGAEATVGEYLDELTGALARGILSTARRPSSNPRPSAAEDPQVRSEEFR